MSNHSLGEEVTCTLLQTIGRKYLSKEAYERALELCGILPDKREWNKFINIFFLLLGIILLLTGISFFFAYNWASLSKFFKLGIIQAGILVCLGLVFYKGIDSLIGKSFLVAASILVGTFLVVFGQIYQTGADAYELFAGWFCFIAGWAIVANSNGLWFIAIVILNLAVGLGAFQTYNLDEAWQICLLLEVLAAIQFLPLIIWETLSSRWEWMKARWFSRLLILALLYFLIFPVLIFIFSRQEKDIQHLAVQIAPFLYGAFAFFLFWYYQYKKQDILVLTMNCIGLIIVFSCMMGKSMHRAEEMIFLSIFVIIQASIASFWLRKVWRKWIS